MHTNYLDNKAAFLLIIFFCFIGNYTEIMHFGFYEDDYALITPFLHMDLKSVANVWGVVLENTFSRGRPLGYILTSFFTIIGYHVAGIPGIQFFGFLIITVNGYICYKIISSRFPDYIGLYTGIILVLYPALTVKQYLTHTLHLESSLLIGLMATYMFVSGRRKCSYLVAVLSLFTYELGILPYLFAPLFYKDLIFEKRVRKLLFHLGICILIIFLVATARIYAGDYRFSSPHYLNSTAVLTEDSIIKFFKALFIGPWVSMESFIKAESWVNRWLLRNMSIMIFGMVGAGVGYIIAIKARSMICKNKYYLDEKVTFNIPLINSCCSSKRVYLSLVNALVTSLICLSGAYLFNLPKYPPNYLFTRNVSEHLASIFGGSLLAACILFYTLYISTCLSRRIYKNIAKYLSCMFVGLFFGMLVAYGRIWQLDAVNVWTIQKAFWTQFETLVPDLEKGTRVYLYKDKNIPFALNLQPFSGSSSLVLGQLYSMPKAWKVSGPFWYQLRGNNAADGIRNYPRVMLIKPTWWKHIEFKEDMVMVNLGYNKWISSSNNFENGNLIILHFKNGRLERMNKDIAAENGVVFVKKITNRGNKVRFEPGPLYRYLIDESLKDMTYPKYILSLMQD